jgi:hypothetical protein
MAKSKKQPSAEASEKKPAPPAKKPTAAKKSAKPAGGATGMPSIDTNLAAQSAANMVANRDKLPTTGGEKADSASFKQFKDSLNKPAAHGPASFLHNSAPQKKSNLPFGARKQVGHNQTFGADVNRTGVPRRTGG